MADKEVHVVDGGGGAGMVLVALLLLALVVGIGLLLMRGGLRLDSNPVNVNIEAPKAPKLPDSGK
jgi:hypothetical protein